MWGVITLKYNVKTVIDYVEGNDLSIDIEILESDSNFMKSVIEYTGDKQMYNFCADNVMANYKFVKFLINKFNTDFKFVNTVVENYLSFDDSNTVINAEILVMMNRLSIKNGLKNDYTKLALTFSEREMITIFALIDLESDPDALKSLGTGFIYILEKYGDSKIVLDFFAVKFMNHIFNVSNNIKLEDLIHQNFENPNQIRKMGIKTFLINYIALKDSCLSSYVQSNAILLSDFEKAIDGYINRWDNYNNVFNNECLSVFFQKSKKVFNQYKKQLKLSYNQIVKYIVEKYSLENFFKDYIDVLTKTPDISSMDFTDILVINKIESMAKIIFEREIKKGEKTKKLIPKKTDYNKK